MKKVILALLIVFTVLLAVSCGCDGCRDGSDDTERSVDKIYKDITDEYKELLKKKKNGEEIVLSNDGTVNGALLAIASVCEDPDAMGYAVKDINKDGTDELVLMEKGNKIYALITVVDGKSVLVDTFFESGTIDLDGVIYKRVVSKDSDGKLVNSYLYAKTLTSDGKLAGFELGTDVTQNGHEHYKVINGEKTGINWYEIQELERKYSDILSESELTAKKAGFYFIPVFGERKDSGDAIDLSCYDGIIAAAKKFGTYYGDFTQEKYVNGEYDGIFSFKNVEEYDVFNKLFWSGYVFSDVDSGYAQKDINGDGVDELILMNANYEISAVFTMKENVPVMVYNSCGRSTFIDENGRICVTNYFTPMWLDVAVYSIEDAKLNTLMHIGVHPGESNYEMISYKIENGKIKYITTDERVAIAKEYSMDCPDDCSDLECMKLHTGIGFIPFEKYTPDPSLVGEYIAADLIGPIVLSIKFVTAEEIDFSTELYTKEDGKTLINAVAVKNGEKYVFDNGTVKGSLEFYKNSILLSVSESQDENINCGVYFMTPDE